MLSGLNRKTKFWMYIFLGTVSAAGVLYFFSGKGTLFKGDLMALPTCTNAGTVMASRDDGISPAEKALEDKCIYSGGTLCKSSGMAGNQDKCTCPAGISWREISCCATTVVEVQNAPSSLNLNAVSDSGIKIGELHFENYPYYTSTSIKVKRLTFKITELNATSEDISYVSKLSIRVASSVGDNPQSQFVPFGGRGQTVEVDVDIGTRSAQNLGIFLKASELPASEKTITVSLIEDIFPLNADPRDGLKMENGSMNTNKWPLEFGTIRIASKSALKLSTATLPTSGTKESTNPILGSILATGSGATSPPPASSPAPNTNATGSAVGGPGSGSTADTASHTTVSFSWVPPAGAIPIEMPTTINTPVSIGQLKYTSLGNFTTPSIKQLTFTVTGLTNATSPTNLILVFDTNDVNFDASGKGTKSGLNYTVTNTAKFKNIQLKWKIPPTTQENFTIKIAEKTDIILIAGDFENTSFPLVSGAIHASPADTATTVTATVGTNPLIVTSTDFVDFATIAMTPKTDNVSFKAIKFFVPALPALPNGITANQFSFRLIDSQRVPLGDTVIFTATSARMEKIVALPKGLPTNIIAQIKINALPQTTTSITLKNSFHIAFLNPTKTPTEESQTDGTIVPLTINFQQPPADTSTTVTAATVTSPLTVTSTNFTDFATIAMTPKTDNVSFTAIKFFVPTLPPDITLDKFSFRLIDSSRIPLETAVTLNGTAARMAPTTAVALTNGQPKSIIAQIKINALPQAPRAVTLSNSFHIAFANPTKTASVESQTGGTIAPLTINFQQPSASSGGTTSGLSASLDSGNPTAKYIAAGAVEDVLKFKITSTAGNIQLNSLTLNFSNDSTVDGSDIDKVELYEGDSATGTKIGSWPPTTVGTVTFNFVNGYGFSAAGEKHYTARVKLTSDATNNGKFKIGFTPATDIVSSVTANGSTLSSALFTIGTAPAAPSLGNTGNGTGAGSTAGNQPSAAALALQERISQLQQQIALANQNQQNAIGAGTGAGSSGSSGRSASAPAPAQNQSSAPAQNQATDLRGSAPAPAPARTRSTAAASTKTASLRSSARLANAPESSKTGPEILIYFEIFGATSMAWYLRKYKK